MENYAEMWILPSIEPAVIHFLTPVPGGVGAVTTAVLAKHLVLAGRRQRELDGIFAGFFGDSHIFLLLNQKNAL